MGLEIIFRRLILDILFKAYPVYQNSYKKIIVWLVGISISWKQLKDI